jgi:CheY-like chemotaxis protein
MFQALVNLLDNAIRHSPDGGRVAVEARTDRGHVRFSVSDAGPGISEDELPHVFDRFWQGRRQNRAGAGLGLTIVKGVVEAHGGRIWVESRPGQGATFLFTIPFGGQALPEGRPNADKPAAGSPEASEWRATMAATDPASTTVFLADDDDDFRTGLKQALVTRGYEVREANDGATALELLARAADGRSPPPDVVVLDVRMPGCSGLGVLSAMRKLPVMPPTLLVTGFRDSSVNVLAERLGVFRVLFKPVEVDPVLEAVLEAAQRGPAARRPPSPWRPRVLDHPSPAEGDSSKEGRR